MILSPANWNAILAPERPWQEAYAAVGEEVKRIFSSPGVTGRVSTNDLAELLYPEKWARDAGIKARKRLFKALAALAEHELKDYCEHGEPRPMKNQPGKIIRPLIWRKPPQSPLYELRQAFEAWQDNRAEPTDVLDALERFLAND